MSTVEFVPDRSLGTSHARAQQADATAVQHGKAVRYVARSAHDAKDLRLLLDALGLKPQEGRTDVEAH